LSVPVVLLALVWFLRFTHYGVAIRAAADTAIAPSCRFSGGTAPTVVWSIRGLSALAVLAARPILVFVSYSSVSAVVLTVVADAHRRGVADERAFRRVAASIGLGIAEQLGAWTVSETARTSMPCCSSSSSSRCWCAAVTGDATAGEPASQLGAVVRSVSIPGRTCRMPRCGSAVDIVRYGVLAFQR